MQLKRKERKPKGRFKRAVSVLLWRARVLSLGGSFRFGFVLSVFCFALYPLIISLWAIFPSFEPVALPALGGSLQPQKAHPAAGFMPGSGAGQRAALSAPESQRLSPSQKERPPSGLSFWT